MKKLAKLDKELILAYIGQNNRRLVSRRFNFPMLFFSYFYLFYRKMFLFGLVLCFLDIFLINLLTPHLDSNLALATAKSLALIFLLNFILSFLVNRLYLLHVRHKVHRIKNANPGLEPATLLVICVQRGGTSLSMIFIGFLITFGVIILVTLALQSFGLKSPYQTISNHNGFLDVHPSAELSPEKSHSDQTSSPDSNSDSDSTSIYKGTLSPDTSVDIAQEFTLTVPNQFTGYSTAYEYEYLYSLEDTEPNQCGASLFAVQNFHDAKSLIAQMAAYDSAKSATPQEIIINDLRWYWFVYDNNYLGQTYYYATDKGGKVYVFEYQLVNNDQSPGCAEFRSTIVSSIKPVHK